MSVTLKIRKIGNSLGVILPREIAEPMHLRAGDELHAIAQPGSGVMLSPYDPNFEDAMAAFERTRVKYRNALRELAK
jgi:putative addiction module antidote